MKIGSIEELLKDQGLYGNVPNWKIGEIDFFLDRIRENVNKVDPLSREKPGVKRVNDSDIAGARDNVSYYSDAFFAAVIGFFDTLAIYHTSNRADVYKKIHFKSWLDKQLGNNAGDKYLETLKRHDEEWISDFRKDRNKFVHNFHPWLAITRDFEFSFNIKEKAMKRSMFMFEFEAGVEELLPHFEMIRKKLGILLTEVNKNMGKQYKYP